MSSSKESSKSPSNTSSPRMDASKRTPTNSNAAKSSSNDTNNNNSNSRKSREETQSSAQSAGLIKIVAILLILVGCYLTVFPPNPTPVEIVLEKFNNLFNGRSAVNYSHSQPRSRKSDGKNSGNLKEFGAPDSELYSTTSPLYARRILAQEQSEKLRSEKQERKRQQANNNIFGQFFQGDDDDDDEDQQTEDLDNACKGYFCYDTGVCVDQPIQCPCPYYHDTKCIRGSWYSCYRGKYTC